MSFYYQLVKQSTYQYYFLHHWVKRTEKINADRKYERDIHVAD